VNRAITFICAIQSEFGFVRLEDFLDYKVQHNLLELELPTFKKLAILGIDLKTKPHKILKSHGVLFL
jgi:hypothetical protein